MSEEIKILVRCFDDLMYIPFCIVCFLFRYFAF